VGQLREPVQRIADRILSLATSPERRGLLGTRIQPARPVMMISRG